MAKDRGDIAIDAVAIEEDIEKIVEKEMAAAKENASAPVEITTRRKAKKVHRQNSKENSVNTLSFIHKPRLVYFKDSQMC